MLKGVNFNMYLTLIVSDNCEACNRAKHVLHKIKIDYPEISTNIVNIKSYKKKGILITPALLVNEDLFSYGDINKDKLLSVID